MFLSSRIIGWLHSRTTTLGRVQDGGSTITAGTRSSQSRIRSSQLAEAIPLPATVFSQYRLAEAVVDMGPPLADAAVRL
jgi:hypothetical protein